MINVINQRPSISVVIPVYNRKQFVNEAIKSIIDTNVNNNIIEIIVVTNIDLDISLKNDFVDLKIIKTDEKELSKKIKIGIIAANADIIAFLEDDDLWVNNKVYHILSIFNNKDIDFYHNNFLQFRGIPKKEDYVYLQNNFFEIPAKDIRNSVKNIKLFIKKFHPDYNLSSMVIRKSSFVPYIKFFDKFGTFGLDGLIFFIALAYGNHIYIDKNILTLIRIHKANSYLIMFSNSDIEFKDISELINEIPDKNVKLLLYNYDLLKFIVIKSKNINFSRIELIKVSYQFFKNSLKLKSFPQFWIIVIIISRLISYKLYKIILLYYHSF
jgi:glycosyltransferase involved in cell wall biosynthesis